MTVDLVSLRTALEFDARYDAAVVAGNNRGLLSLFNDDEEAGQTTFLQVDSEDVLDAIGDGVRGLSTARIETLRLFTSRETVDFRKQSIRRELRQIFTGNPDVLGRLQAVSSRPSTYAERFGGQVTLQDLAVLSDVPKSHRAKKEAADNIQKQANEDTIAKLGATILQADSALKPSAVRSRAIREMYEQKLEYVYP